MSRRDTTDSEESVDGAVQHERSVLSDADFERVQTLLENPPGPTSALKEAVARRTGRRMDESVSAARR
jgi:uncharacterized protein (DUF1778 family)